MNSKVRTQQALIEKLKSDSKKVSNDAAEKSGKLISEQVAAIKTLHNNINDLKLKEKKMIEENKQLLVKMKQLKSEHEDKLASASKKQNEETHKEITHCMQKAMENGVQNTRDSPTLHAKKETHTNAAYNEKTTGTGINTTS